MKILTTFIASTLFAIPLLANEPAGLEVSAFVGSGGSYTDDFRAKGDRSTIMFIIFTNRRDKPMTVLTNLGRASFSPPGTPGGKPENASVDCSIELQMWVHGTLIMPSICEVKPTPLGPGESAGAEISVRFPPGTKLDEVYFMYKVEKAVGVRYGAWYGVIDTVLKRQSIAGIPIK